MKIWRNKQFLFFKVLKAVIEEENITLNEDDLKNVCINILSLQATDTLDIVYTKPVILEWELSFTEIQVAAGKTNFRKLLSAFKNFLSILIDFANNKTCLIDKNDKFTKLFIIYKRIDNFSKTVGRDKLIVRLSFYAFIFCCRLA